MKKTKLFPAVVILILITLTYFLSINSKSKYLEHNPSEYSLYEEIFNSSKTTESIFEDENQTYNELELNEHPPAYTGTPYIYINNNNPTIDDNLLELDIGTYYYSELDQLGRVGLCYCIIDSSCLPTEPRGDISDIYPTGWKQNDYGDLINNSYIYNRCHLIPASFNGPCGRPGEDDNILKRNLFTGTRYLNVDGQWQFEETVLYYLKENSNSPVIYVIEPIFINSELVARGVHIQAKSLEDDKISFNVYCFNVQPKIHISYDTGTNWLEEDTSSAAQE